MRTGICGTLASILLSGTILGCTSLNQRDYNTRRNETLVSESHGWTEVGNNFGMHYIREGNENERKVLLLHGLCMSSYTWRDIIPYLSKSFDVYAVDFIGFGYSDKPKNFNYGLKSLGKTILSFMDKMTISKASIVGNSLGGGVGIYLAANYPDRVESLVLVDSIGSSVNEPIEFNFFKIPAVSIFFENPKNIVDGIEGLMHAERRGLREYGIPYEMHDAWDSLRSTLRVKNPKEVIGNLIDKIDVPTLVVAGRYDNLVTLNSSESIYERVNDSKLLILESGHFPQEEVPNKFSREIYNFLNENTSR